MYSQQRHGCPDNSQRLPVKLWRVLVQPNQLHKVPEIVVLLWNILLCNQVRPLLSLALVRVLAWLTRLAVLLRVLVMLRLLPHRHVVVLVLVRAKAMTMRSQRLAVGHGALSNHRGCNGWLWLWGLAAHAKHGREPSLHHHVGWH